MLASTLGLFCLPGAYAALDPAHVQSALAKLPGYVQPVVANGSVPGIAVAVVYNGSVQFAQGYGIREVNQSALVDADTVFAMASVSKPISSTIVAAILSNNANLSWETKISHINPQARLADVWATQEMTIADLFSMRSGLYGLAGDDLEIFGYDRDTILSRLQYLPTAHSFRSTYDYSNFGITLGAISASNAINMTWEDAADHFLYSPLNMSSTSSRFVDFQNRENKVRLHIPRNGSWVPATPRNPNAEAPAGGVTSSVRDLGKWVQMLLALGMHDGKSLVNATYLNESHRGYSYSGPQPENGQPGYYGLGWTVRYQYNRLFNGHAGAFSQGTRTYVKMCVEDGIGIIVLANCFPTGYPEAIADTFMDWVYFNQTQQDWAGKWNGLYAQLFAGAFDTPPAFAQKPQNDTSALAIKQYLGMYSNDYVGTVIVSGNGTSMLELKTQGNSYSLEHWTRDVFILRPFTEAPDYPTAVTFAIGPDGSASGMVIDALNGYGGGILVKTG